MLVGMQASTATLQNNLAVSYKVKKKKKKNTPNKGSSNSTPRYLPKFNENSCLYKNLHVSVYMATFLIAKNWK